MEIVATIIFIIMIVIIMFALTLPSISDCDDPECQDCHPKVGPKKFCKKE